MEVCSTSKVDIQCNVNRSLLIADSHFSQHSRVSKLWTRSCSCVQYGSLTCAAEIKLTASIDRKNEMLFHWNVLHGSSEVEMSDDNR